jgi:hypothetical protein
MMTSCDCIFDSQYAYVINKNSDNLTNKNLITNKGWFSIIEHKELSNDKIEDFVNNIIPQLNINENECWDIISNNQKLSEEFIEKYQDKLNWSSISLFQDLSWDFIQKFSKKIVLKNLSNNDCLNENLINLIKENDELFNDELIL